MILWIYFCSTKKRPHLQPATYRFKKRVKDSKTTKGPSWSRWGKNMRGKGRASRRSIAFFDTSHPKCRPDHVHWRCSSRLLEASMLSDSEAISMASCVITLRRSRTKENVFYWLNEHTARTLHHAVAAKRIQFVQRNWCKLSMLPLKTKVEPRKYPLRKGETSTNHQFWGSQPLLLKLSQVDHCQGLLCFTSIWSMPTLPLQLMEEILHQLRLVVYPIIYRVFYMPRGAGFLSSTLWPFLP